MQNNFHHLKNSTVSRLLGRFTVVLFFAWFVLPCCHCQWDAIFGGSTESDEPTAPAFVLDTADGASMECHCDDHSPKTFDLATGADGWGKLLPQLTFISTVNDQGGGPIQRSTAYLTRGPPTGVDLPQFSEQRAYVRHRALLL